MSTGAPGSSFEERFAALRRDWRAQLPGKLDDIRDRLKACLASPHDADALQELHRHLHTLAGSAGTFGLEDLGAQARVAEHELDRLMALPARDAAAFARAQQLLQELLAHAPRE